MVKFTDISIKRATISMLEILFTTRKTFYDDLCDFVYEIEGKIYGSDEVSEEIEVGQIKAFYLDKAAILNQGKTTYDVMDSHSDQLFRFFPLLFEKNGDYKHSILEKLGCFGGISLLVIDRIIIYPEFRGKGLGLAAIVNTIQTFAHDCGCIALQAYPLQFEASHDRDDNEWFYKMQLDKYPLNESEATKKLSSYYSKIGFELLEGTEFMIRSGERKLPKLISEGFDINELKYTVSFR